MRKAAPTDAYRAHLHARRLRARAALALVRRLLRRVRKWLEHPWARLRHAASGRLAFR